MKKQHARTAKTRRAAQITGWLLAAALLLLPVPVRGLEAEQEPTSPPDSLSSRAAIVIDGLTGAVLDEKNADEQLPMASTTKIMTALLTLEAGEPESAVITTSEMVTVEGTSMGLKSGDSVTRYGLCCGMLLCSGNDAANTAAISVAGSLDAFVVLMNQKATQLGMCSTHFSTPSGLDKDGHFSTARDMAVLAAYAMKNETFRAIVSSEKLTVDYGNPPYRRTLTNHNKLLWQYAGAVGVKTGFTKKAGRCLVSSAEREGGRLIAVTLKAPDDWNDHKALLNYGFTCLESVTLDTDTAGITLPVTGGVRPCTAVTADCSAPITLSVAKNFARSLSRDILTQPVLYAPLRADTPVGEMVFRAKGVEIARIKLLPAVDLDAAVTSRLPGFAENLRRLLRL